MKYIMCTIEELKKEIYFWTIKIIYVLFMIFLNLIIKKQHLTHIIISIRKIPHFPKISKEVGLQYIKKERTPRKLLVDVLVFTLMPNHFHLMIRQKTEDGITKFMRKIGTGYTNYFNKKYERVGSLFQGKYKSVRIATEQHLIHLPYYIHMNPLDMIAPKWRQKEITNYHKALLFLESYRWSSHSDYIGKKNFPSVTQRDFLLKLFDGIPNYKKSFIQWLKERDLENIGDDITLEH